jgi:hypothetical protein
LAWLAREINLILLKDPNGERGYFGADHHLERKENG